MNTNRILALSFGLLLAPLALPAQDTTNAPPTQPATNAVSPKVDMEKIRQQVRAYSDIAKQIKNLPPEEAAKKRVEMNQLRIQQMQGQSPAERRAWMEEWRKTSSALAGASVTERRAKVITERLEMLRAKKAEGKTTEADEKAIVQLERLEKEVKERMAAEKAAEKPADKSADNSADKPTEKSTNKPAEKTDPAKS